MRRSLLNLLCLAACLAGPLGCSHGVGDEMSRTSTVADTAAVVSADAAAELDLPGRAHDVGILFGEGAPHVGTLSSLVASADGRSALTLDSVGELRLWRSVDGESRPLRVPAEKVHEMSIASSGQGDGEIWRAALVHSDGGASVWEVSAQGKSEVVLRLPPTEALRSVTVLPQSRGYLALGQDSKLRWLSAAGDEIARLEMPRFPASRLQIGAQGKLWLIAPLSDAKGQQVRLRRFVMADQTISPVGGELVLDTPPQFVRWDVDRGRAWYAEHRDASRRGQIRFVDIAVADSEGKPDPRSWISLPSTVHQAAPLGLLTNGDLVVELRGNGVLAVSPTGKVRGLALRVDVGGPVQWANGRRFSGHGTHLGVESPGERSLYMGYRNLSSIQAALDPSGSRVAWAGPSFIDIEDADGHVRRLEPGGLPRTTTELLWLDDTTLILFHFSGGAELVDVKSGQVLDQVDIGGNFTDARLAADGSAVALRTQTWGSRQLLWIADRSFQDHATVLDTGSFYGVLEAPAGASEGRPGLWTYDGARIRRFRYEHLRKGIDAAERTELEQERPDSTVQFVLAGPDGEALWMGSQQDSGRFESHVWRFTDTNDKSLDVKLGIGAPTWMRLDASGKHLLAILTENNGRRIAHLVDVNAGSHLWKRPLSNDALVEWSQGGEHLLAQSPSSGVQVWRARDGETLRARCAFEFEVLRVPPVATVAASEYLCE